MLFLAEAAGEPIGYTMLVLGEPTDAAVLAAVAARPTSQLSKCYVAPGHHGAGVAAELMAATVEAARERGAVSMWLTVNEENLKAQRFYAKNGFAKVGETDFLVGDRWEHDHVLERAL